MARSKNIHLVNFTVEIEQPNDPGSDWAQGAIQVDKILSQQLGRTIRNGNAFRLIGMGAQLRGFTGTPDQDLGFAGVTTLQYCPVTKGSAGIHQKVFDQWMRQKKLAGAVGEYVRYDDFEIGWSADTLLSTGRNSQIRYSGLDDSTLEHVALYGDSTTSGDRVVTLQDIYDNLNPVNPASETAFDVAIKQPKFTTRFPDPVSLEIASTFSAVAHENTPPIEDEYFAQVATGGMIWLPSDNHLSHLTGTINYFFKGVSPDTIVPIADTLKLTITLAYEGWSPLNEKRRKTSKKSVSTSKK